jgi:hypothetical protein
MHNSGGLNPFLRAFWDLLCGKFAVSRAGRRTMRESEVQIGNSRLS